MLHLEFLKYSKWLENVKKFVTTWDCTLLLSTGAEAASFKTPLTLFCWGGRGANPSFFYRLLLLKIEVIEKLVRDTMLLNMIFKATKNKNKSRRWVVYLKYWASCGDFFKSSRTKSQFLKKIKSQNFAQFLRLGSEFLQVISIFI